MTNLAKLFAATAAIGSLAAPAAAQYQYPQQSYPQQSYPQQTYPQYQQQYQVPDQAYGYAQQGYNQGYASNNSIGSIINQLLGNNYNVTDRQAVSQCASAAMAQAQSQYRGYGQRNYGYNQGYNQGYNRGYGQAMRVTAITDVQRRSSGLRVKGLISTGYAGNRGYGGYQNQGYARGDLSFRCNVDYRGAVSNVRLSSNNG
jgi:hypothetical protein